MPPGVAKKKDVAVEFKTSKLKVQFMDHPDPAFDSELEHAIDPGGCSWQIDGRMLVIAMEKAEGDYEAQSLGGWEAVFKGAGFCAPKLLSAPAQAAVMMCGLRLNFSEEFLARGKSDSACELRRRRVCVFYVKELDRCRGRLIITFNARPMVP